MVVVDAHHHLWPAEAVADQAWQPAGTALRRAFEPADLLPELARAGVTGTVLMQSVDGPAENDRLGAYAAAAAPVRGIVAWAPLDRPVAAHATLDDLLDRRAAGVPVVGVRYLAGTDPMTVLTAEENLAVLRRVARAGLAWDVVPVTDSQRAAVVRVARAIPDLRVVVDHLAAPPVPGPDAPPGAVAEADDAWTRALTDLAGAPNVAVKLSVGVAVLTRWGGWDTGRVRGWVHRALDAFGPDRAMAASNWPVVLLRAPYAQAWGDVRAAVEGPLSPTEAWAVLGGTATTWYDLERVGHG